MVRMPTLVAAVTAALLVSSATVANAAPPPARPSVADIERGRPTAGEHGPGLSAQTSQTWSLRRPSPGAKRALHRSGLTAGRHPSGRQPDEPYQPQVACYAGELPGVVQFRDMLLTAFPRSDESLHTYNITRGCNVPGVSEHEEGRALDWEAHVADPAQDRQARQLLRWLTRDSGYQAKRFGIMYIIYDQHVWGQYNQSWRLMADRGNVTDNHKDHVHFSFTWNGALQRSAFWTGQARRVHRGPCARYQGHFASLDVTRLAAKPRVTRCPAPRPIPDSWTFSASIMYWQQDRRVRWLQQFLTEQGLYSGETNGAFGSLTYDAVHRYQSAHRLGTTGVWDPATQNASGRTVGARSETATSWDLHSGSAVADVPLDVAVTVSPVEGVPRTVHVERRSPGGPWAVVTDGARTDLSGNAHVVFPAEVGVHEYRVVADQTSYARAGNSTPVTLIVPTVPPVSPSRGEPNG